MKTSTIGDKTTTAGKQGANRHLAWILHIWRERGLLVALLFFLTLLSSAVTVAYPYLSKLLLDTIQNIIEVPGSADPMHEIDRLLLVILVVGLAGMVASIFPGIRAMTNVVFEHLIRSKYFRIVMSKDFHFFARFSSGDIVTRLTDDIHDFQKLSWFLCSGIFRAVESISKVGFCLTAMFIINPALTFYSLIPLPIMIIIFYFTQDRIHDTYKKNQEAISAINTRLEMSFSGVRIIKAYACEDKYRRFFTDILDRRWHTEMAVAKLEALLRLIYQYIDYIAQAGIFFAGGIMAVKGQISIGTFYAFYTYLAMLIYPILDIPQLLVSGKRAFVNIDRLEELASFPAPPQTADAHPVQYINSIELRNVAFSYPDRPGKVLSDISFSIQKGQRIGLIGPVGSGKSTMVKLLLGLLPPVSGELLVNGLNLQACDMEAYRSRVGYVPQEALLFSGTLRENVDFGSDRPDDSIFAQAVETAQLKDEIASFIEKANTRIGQRGISLSGGQKQRVAIARAMARQPELLLFDDITASLDATNEERLMMRLDQQSAGLTCLIVSHRLSTLQYVDKVLFLDAGRVKGFGTHEQLMGQPAYQAFIAEHLSTD